MIVIITKLPYGDEVDDDGIAEDDDHVHPDH